MLVLPMLLSLDRLDPSILMIAFPAAIVLALPFGVGAGVDAIRRDRTVPAHVARTASLELALGACALMFVLLAWVLPAGKASPTYSIASPIASAW